ncbi:MAG: oligosaccharide flippase family protein [Anaerolinea sp.]|nr:oligosaccharide flippase family protein [Anaerolinea sp.]
MIQAATSQMVQLWRLCHHLFSRPTFLFTFNRYIGYALQFVRGILLAKMLGPLLFGVWGFLTLMIQYLSYTGLGLQYAINVELAVKEGDDSQTHHAHLIGVTLTATVLIAIVLLLAGFAIQSFQIPLFTKYSFSQYALVLALLIGLTHLNQVYANIYRVYQKLGRITAYEFVLAFLPLAAIFFFRDEQLVMASLLAMVLANVIGILVYTFYAPFPIQFLWDAPLLRYLLALGIPLLIYNLSFWLITLVGRTIISIFYSVETMGYFSLANNITNATLLGLRAVAWVVFPTVLVKTRYGLPDDRVRQTVRKVNTVYGTAVFLAIWGMILLTPLLFIILPQYQSSIQVLIILLLSQAVLSMTFGYNSLAIARKQHIKVAGIALIAVGVVFALGLAAAWSGMDMLWVATAMLVGSIVFSLLQAWLGERLIQQDQTVGKYWFQVMSAGSFIAVTLALTGCLTGHYLIFNMLGVLAFSVGNRSALKQLWQYVRSF